MTLVAVHAVPDITVNALVFRIGLTLGMAARTLEDRIVIGIGVASSAYALGPTVVHREVRVVKLRVEPRGRIVARFARRREMRRRVVWICGAVVIRLMAGVTRRSRDVVVAIDVAISASPRWHRMQTCECPARRSVVELAVHPVDGVMAGFAGRRELGSNVIHRRLRVVVVV